MLDPPSYPISQDNHSNQANHFSNHRRTPHSSPTSSISSTSSIWAGGKSSVTSSRTTLPSEEEGDQEQGQKPYLRLNDVQERKREINDAGGFTWNKVSEAANVFTQEVTKAWTAGLNPLGLSNGYSGADKEEESHLTRVMRAYHLSKARTPSELPDWLFSERERGQVGLLRLDARHVDTLKETSGTSRNQVATSQLSSTRNFDAGLKNFQNFPTPVARAPALAKASGTDRLKILRDSRRNNAPAQRI
ncbi:hypothetical protein HYPSUDRAFT_818903 [Hypholoma sublateritium FD-334 SS-4]|uniref:Uncharacterized protein n=1 Tax=Hypholoma sublateritium (strain FD-334 SS-4) TaxID=945553 RepID=A0A0D2PJU2_HYPSF|nr:hypothetical protein HYPSUDRAFT_818903 [Hypholoma sublateritium FD-334 SS-4]